MSSPLFRGSRVLACLLLGATFSCGAASNSGAPHDTARAGASSSGAGAETGGSTAGSFARGASGGGFGVGGALGGTGGTGGHAVGGVGGDAPGGAGSGAGGTGRAGGGASAGSPGRGGSAGSTAGSATGGSSGESSAGEGGGGERAIQCTGAMPYFPEFDRSCTADADCVAVAHQTSCCGSELVTGISTTELAAFNAAESTCKQQYPACGCASQGVDVEDGTQIGFSWRDLVAVACDGGTCKAHYSGASFACGTRRCTEAQYCVESTGGPVGSPTTYACNPSACTDCSCITMTGCTCGQTDGHLTFTCNYP